MNKKSAFDIPSLIPPLAASGKENHARPSRPKRKILDERLSFAPLSSSSSNQGTGMSTPGSSSGEAVNNKQPVHQHHSQQGIQRSSLPTPPTKSRPSPSLSILPVGESTETLFGLSAESSQEHRRLAQSIVDGSRTDDPAAWLQLLQSSTGSHSVRLHRRAILRFPLSMDASSEVIQIWMSHAASFVQAGALPEARGAYRQIELHLSHRLDAHFYLTQAKLDPSESTEILRRGIKAKAQPLQLLEEAFAKNSNNAPDSPKRQRTESRFVTRLSQGDPVHGEDVRSSNTKPARPVPLHPKEGSACKRTRPSRLSVRLSRKGLSGKAKRVGHEDSVLESDDEQTMDQDTTLPDATAAPKIKKMDLSYMWAWDPNDRNGGKTADLKLKENTTTQGGEAGNTSQSDSTTADSSATEQSKKEEARPSPPPEPVKPATPSAMNTTLNSTPPTRPGEDPLEGINREFLPLVNENNILRVNGSAYAKLGVIGKGGSCKVYRALSKKCSVVAIKKVKLDGMDEKAIEGYANEISLLKRLKGNPAIIQMHDSQVDLEGKSILLVMELGEVDLNHVLQQRAMSGASRSLNMNFIRLTWQQMLSAVHCIHEERIIHSDLKPANFLFVRGALKLIDFGIAKAIQSDDTTNIYRESHIGTLNYMSPEAILDSETGTDGPRMRIGRASDVWSLGCILYEMVYGRTPFAKLHFIQKLQAIVNPNYQIQFEGSDINEAAIEAIKFCLRRNPEERPPIVGKGGLLNEHRFLHAP
eukprot:Nitzschia sp. Nitz4//scaffold92_size79448//36209//38549//NITZ4_005390-RA/size79448-augustus-gene-0.22-mRNA-1//1//CDS//3329560183//3940//frame0